MVVRMRPLGARRRGDRGAAALEFALLLPVLLMLVFGIIQYGLYLWGMQAGSNAAADAVRQLSVGNCLSAGELRAYLADRVAGPAGDDSSIVGSVAYHTADGTPTDAPVVGGNVDVRVRFDVIDLQLPFVPLPNGGVVTRDSDARIEDDVSGGCGA